MAGHEKSLSQTLTDVVGRFVQEEKQAMESLRIRMADTKDPNVQSVFAKLAEIRARYVAELESQFGDVASREEITRQINEMFNV
ncbi:MAG: hypothetical protein WBD36_14125 [Bacteroidota bacterium]